MSQQEEFERGVAFVQNSKDTKLSNTVKLRFYALYKLATVGPCTTKAPSKFRVTEYMKWKAYNDMGSKLSKDEARAQYVEELNKLMPGWNATAKL